MSQRSLEQVIADKRGELPVLRKHGQAALADALEEFAREVADSAEDYLTWLTEKKAELRSGRSERWLRSQFPAWEREGHAKVEHGHRYYRAIIVPQRANTISAYEDGRRSANEDAA